MDITIRGIDAAALKKIDALAREKGQSRNTFVREALESLAILSELKAMEDKYKNLVEVLADIVKVNTDAINRNSNILEKYMEER